MKTPNEDMRLPIVVKVSALPLSCPREQAQIWHSHPKVYLPIEKTGEAVCPYCSTHYILKDN